jgi:hypothetical protein
VLFVTSSLYLSLETTIVVLRDRDQVYVEVRNRLTGKKTRHPIGKVSDLSRVDIRAFVETDNELFPYPCFEVLIRVGNQTTSWFTYSREVAEAVRQELIRIGGNAAP